MCFEFGLRRVFFMELGHLCLEYGRSHALFTDTHILCTVRVLSSALVSVVYVYILWNKKLKRTFLGKLESNILLGVFQYYNISQ